MQDSSYQHLCNVLVGVAMLFRFIGYDLASFIVESLVHSAHDRDPVAMIDHAGYYGQAIKEITGCLATFVVPVVLNYLHPKWALALGSGLFACYIACFFHVNTYLFFFGNALLGFGYALSYTALSTYQMQFSTRKTLARNATVIWSIASMSLLIGGSFYIYVTLAHQPLVDELLLSNATTTTLARAVNASSSSGSAAEAGWLCGFVFGCLCLATLLQCCHPSREVAKSVCSENPQEKLSLRAQLKATAAVLVDPRVLYLIPRFLNHGFFVSFYVVVYPTSLQYSSILAKKYPMMTAYYAFAMCAGTTVCCLIIKPLNRRFADFGLRPLYYITVGVQLLTFLIATLTVPNWATARPTAEGSLIEPNLVWVCLVAFLLGFTSNTNVASLTVICSRLIQGRASHTISAARFYYASFFAMYYLEIRVFRRLQGIAASAIFLCSPALSMQAHAIILTSTTVLSTVCFNRSMRHMKKAEIKHEGSGSTDAIQE